MRTTHVAHSQSALQGASSDKLRRYALSTRCGHKGAMLQGASWSLARPDYGRLGLKDKICLRRRTEAKDRPPKGISSSSTLGPRFRKPGISTLGTTRDSGWQRRFAH